MTLIRRTTGKAHSQRDGAGIGFQVDGGAVSNVRDTINFIQTPGIAISAVDDPGNNRNNVTLSMTGWGVLQSVSGIDATTVADTSLFTVPTGFSAQIAGVVLRCTEATAITTPADAGVGVSPSTSNIIPIQTLTGLTSSGLFFRFPPGGIGQIAVASDVIQIRIDTAATGTSQTLAADVIGRLFT